MIRPRPRHPRRPPAGPMLPPLLVFVLALAPTTLLPPSLVAQDGRGAPERAPVGARRQAPALEAVRLEGARPVLDGRIDEPLWRSAPVAQDFVQFEPDPGASASQRTEARVLYTDDELWVAIRAFDTAPDSIASQLTRRDQGSYSDLVGVVIDSYFDRRTAFHFEVNPKGVQRDTYRFDDTQEDAGWDAVWEVATATDAEGWSAEFRIPLSQLRFRDAPVQTWGINFTRRIARYDEMALWAPTERAESAIVSRFGELRGIRNLEPPRRLELTPYTLARLERAPGNPANPFYARNETFGTVGADLKYGITSDLTLNVTLNPDFGQVEADPAQVNLSAYETFLPERRPFFVEGSNLFNFSLALGDGDDAVESLFYSRRIGRSPQGWADPRGGWVDAEDRTTILGAWKLSGKTAGGWSIGLLHAVTAEESADIATGAGERLEQTVEPFTNHSVARFQRDFREGRSAIGLIGTAVSRDTDVADSLGLRTGGYTAGVDARHRFAGDRYQLRGYAMASHIRGSADAIAAAQRSSARYFQRPDAEHLSYDPARTSLSGLTTALTIAKISGGHWRWSTGFQSRSPGFDSNDAGYLREADFVSGFVYGGYDQSSPQGPFRRWRLNLNGWSSWSFGGERYNSGGNINGNAQLANFWNAYMGVNHNRGGLSNGVLRGGPAFRTESNWNGWMGLNTDSRAAVQLNLNANWNVRPESDSWSVNASPSVRWRPSARASLSLGTSVSKNVDDRQWVSRVDGGDPPTYVFGRLEQTTFGLTGRVDYAFTPTLSLQVYAQPFVSAGSYGGFKRVADPRADRYPDRFDPLALTFDDDAGVWRGDVDGDGEADAITRPDFNVRQFRSNTVLRWEYRPGSTFFLVWAQGRNGEGVPGVFEAADDVRGIFSDHPTNTLMLKVSYWLNP